MKSAVWAAGLWLLAAPLVGRAAPQKPQVIEVPTGYGVSVVAFSPDSRTLAVGLDTIGTVRLLDIRSRRWFRTLEARHKVTVNALAFSPDGTMLASGGVGGEVLLSDVRTGKVIKTLAGREDEEAVLGVAFAANGKWLAAGTEADTHDPAVMGEGGDVRVWSLPDGKLRRLITKHLGAVPAVALSRDGARVAAPEDECMLWSVQTGKPLLRYGCYGDAIALSPDGTQLAESDGMYSLRRHRYLTKAYGQLKSLAFTANGRLLVGGSEEDGVYVWEGRTGRQLLDLGRKSGLYGDWNAVSPDGKWVAVGDLSGTLDLCRLPLMKGRNN